MLYSSILNVIKMKRLLSGIFIILLSSFSYAQRVFTLDDCCRIAVENNKKMKLSDFSIKQAELQEKNVVAGFLPKLSASGGYLYANKDNCPHREAIFMPIRIFRWNLPLLYLRPLI